MLVIRKKKCCCGRNCLMTSDFFEFTEERKSCGLRSDCKVCSDNRHKIYRDSHKIEKTEYDRKRYEEQGEYRRVHQKANSKRINLTNKRRRDNNPLVKLKDNIRRRINKAINGKKNKKTIEYLGCEIEQYKEYLEKQFTNGMTWENYGEWHIDHIVPLASTQTKEELEKLFHYTNTQPLWGTDNCRKGARL